MIHESEKDHNNKTTGEGYSFEEQIQPIGTYDRFVQMSENRDLLKRRLKNRGNWTSKVYLDAMANQNQLNDPTEIEADKVSLQVAKNDKPEILQKQDNQSIFRKESKSVPTHDPAKWRDSVRAVGSFDFVTVWWTQPYLDADYYGIYRRLSDPSNPHPSPFYLRGYLRHATDDFYRDYSVRSGCYYDYQVTVYFDNGDGPGSYYMNAFIYRVYVPRI